jgi:hypothetical protein
MTLRPSLKLVIVTAALLLGAMAPGATADPVEITGGVLGYPLLNDARLHISFFNGSADAEWSDEQGDWLPDYHLCCYNAGDRLSVSTDESFPSPFAAFLGELRVGSELYSVTRFEFAVAAVREVIVPPFDESYSPILLTGIPFTFRGLVSGMSADQRVLVADLIGAGSATVELDPLNPFFEQSAYVGGAGYRFEKTPTPVPEPTSLLLIGSGLVAIVARRPHRKRVRDVDGDRVSS